MDLMQFLFKNPSKCLARDKLIFELIWKDTSEPRIKESKVRGTALHKIKISYIVSKRVFLVGVES